MEDRWYFLFSIFIAILCGVVALLHRFNFFDTYGKAGFLWIAGNYSLGWIIFKSWILGFF